MLVAFNKPWGVLCQFTPGRARNDEPPPTLADFMELPGVYPAGRLDKDSEGLLLLTDDGRLQHRIANPAEGNRKTYVVQIEGAPSPQQLRRLVTGVKLKDGPARAVRAQLLARKPGWLWTRPVLVSPRPGRPVSWLEIVLDEGRNRQIRRMTAAVGLPTLRLIRVAIGDWKLDGLQPGQWRVEES